MPKMAMLVDDADLAETMYAGKEAILDGHPVAQ